MTLRFDRILNRLQRDTGSFRPNGGPAATGDERLVVLEFLCLDWPEIALRILEVIFVYLEELLICTNPFLVHASSVTLSREVVPPLLVGDLFNVVSSLASHAHGIRMVYYGS